MLILMLNSILILTFTDPQADSHTDTHFVTLADPHVYVHADFHSDSLTDPHFNTFVHTRIHCKILIILSTLAM